MVIWSFTIWSFTILSFIICSFFTMTYDQAMARLQEIVQQLENGQAISLDQYTKLAKEAKELIEYCRKQLTELDGEIKQILE